MASLINIVNRGLLGRTKILWAGELQSSQMPETWTPSTFRQHVALVFSRALKDFRWIRDTLLGAGLSIASILLQSHWRLITVEDWHEHWTRWILSIAIPYALVIVPHLIWRLGEAPWRVYQELEIQDKAAYKQINTKLTDSEMLNAQFKEHLSKRNWPENRPRITVDRWGNRESGGILKKESGFYLTNHGETALEVMLDDFTLGSDKWSGKTLASIEAKQKKFLEVWRTTFVYGELQRWDLLDGFRTANRHEPVSSNQIQGLQQQLVAVSLVGTVTTNLIFSWPNVAFPSCAARSGSISSRITRVAFCLGLTHPASYIEKHSNQNRLSGFQL